MISIREFFLVQHESDAKKNVILRESMQKVDLKKLRLNQNDLSFFVVF